jgi:CRISPR/Cas system CSM-associated protein Csm2 small subunit
LMERLPRFATTSQFHEAYLREMLNEYNIRYRKSRPNEVLKRYYLEELIKRVQDEPTHLQSFAKFLSLLEMIKLKMKEKV